MTKVVKTDQEWKSLLTPEQYSVCRERGTEPAFSGAYYDCHDPGVYACCCCGAELFSSQAKFDSGTGWPSFGQPVSRGAVETEEDRSFSIRRTEVHCTHCGAHLGHIFSDGPPPTGLRYCINSVSLTLQKSGTGLHKP